MEECIKAEYLQDPDYNVEQEFKLQLKNVNSMKMGKRGVLNRSCKFCYLGQHASIKNHDFS